MDAVERKIVNNYLALIRRLNPTIQQNLIAELTKKSKSKVMPQSNIRAAFGAWADDETAEELCKTIGRNTYL
jgi:hypothetical protein